MTIRSGHPGVVVLLLMADTAAAQLMSPSVENSPERRGETGCSIIASKVLSGTASVSPSCADPTTIARGGVEAAFADSVLGNREPLVAGPGAAR